MRAKVVRSIQNLSYNTGETLECRGGVADPAALETSCSVIPCRRRAKAAAAEATTTSPFGDGDYYDGNGSHSRDLAGFGHLLSHCVAVQHPRCGVLYAVD